MNVTANELRNAMALFASEFIGTFKTTAQKFFGGVAYAGYKNQIDAMLANVSDENGIIDTEPLKAMIEEGMRQCGGEFELPISFGFLGNFGVPPITVRIKLSDVEKFFNQTLPAVASDIKKS